MAKDSKIEWTHHTFNPWWGCTKVSPACDNCYAELWAKRLGKRIWGPDAPRRLFHNAHWGEPLLWNQQASRDGHRARVFCASMADVFERRAELNDQRARLWNLIQRTPHLDWLLLTKRPQNVAGMVPWTNKWPRNIWLGTSVENQGLAQWRLPILLKIPAAVRFVSCEPLLGPLDLRPWLETDGLCQVDWVIAGGESGPNARPMHPDWPKSLLLQCQESGVPFHFKQWGHWVPAELADYARSTTLLQLPNERPVRMARVSKKQAGAGRTGFGPGLNDTSHSPTSPQLHQAAAPFRGAAGAQIQGGQSVHNRPETLDADAAQIQQPCDQVAWPRLSLRIIMARFQA